MQWARYVDAYKKLSPTERYVTRVLNRIWVIINKYLPMAVAVKVTGWLNEFLIARPTMQNIADTLALYYSVIIPPKALLVLYNDGSEADKKEIAKRIDKWLTDAQKTIDRYYRQQAK